MANNYFQFKQFTVQQDQCSMKVCTDACIFGALVAKHLSEHKRNAESILDIGTGTGLLSLLLAQKTNALIDTIEIDKAAALQANKNFEASPWKERLNIFNTGAGEFSSEKKYDCIISNPPFFEDDLKSGDEKKNAAKHDTTLTLLQLLEVTNRYLAPAGIFAVLLPYHRLDYFIAAAAIYHLFVKEKILIKHTATHPYFRGVLFFMGNSTIPITTELAIKETNGNYTPAFNSLLKDYYLNL